MSRRIDLFAIQMHLEAADYLSSAAFAAKISSLFEEMDALRERTSRGSYRYPGLAVFPGDVGTFLHLGQFRDEIEKSSTLEEAFRRISVKRLPRLVWHRTRYRSSSFRALLLMNGRHVYETYYRTFSSLSRRHQLPVVAGSVLLPDNRYGSTATFKLPFSKPRVYSLSMTFDARGEMIHSTRKVNLAVGLEEALELSSGSLDEQRPFEVCNVRIGNAISQDGFLVGAEDGFRPIGPHLVSQGAEILCQPAAHVGQWLGHWPHGASDQPLKTSDAWFEQGMLALLKAHPEIHLGINPMLNGQFLDLTYEGRSTIIGRDAAGSPMIHKMARAHGTESTVEELLKYEALLPARKGLRPPAVG